MAPITTRPADHRVTARHITQATLMACGAREFVHCDREGLLMFRVGSGRKALKVIVTLSADDTYRVEYGQMITKVGPNWGTWKSIEVRAGIQAEDLAETVREMGDR